MNVEFLAPNVTNPVDRQRVSSMELRCRSKLQGIIKEYPSGIRLLEVRCKDKWCAERGAGMVVFHYFNIETGELDHTTKFRDPRKPKQDNETVINTEGEKIAEFEVEKTDYVETDGVPTIVNESC